MHNAALQALKLDALYTAVDVPPRYLKPVLRALVLAGVEGFNVTVPLKEAVIPLLDAVEPSARAIGAVNTILVRNRRLVGLNTDGIGFLKALRELGWQPRGTRAVILGAGGAARAAAWELARLPGAQVTIANRHVSRAQALARWLKRQHPRAQVRASSLKEISLQEANLLVNATTVGMKASEGLLVDPQQLHRGLRVFDMVYPRETALVRAARRRGAVAAGGLSMLLYQGAESLRRWVRRPPPVGVMRRALPAALTDRQQGPR